MKKLLYSIFALGLLATVSCKDDDDVVPTPEPLPTNAVAYKGKNYSFDNGAIIDWGSWENHYNYDFFLTDGEMDFENQTALGATVMLYAELWSPGTENFSTGTFSYEDSENTTGKKFFETVVVVMDTNNNGELDEADDQLTAKAGTIKVSGSGTNYALEMDITLSNDQSLKGTYNGAFELYEGELEGESGERRRMGKAGFRSLNK